MIRLPAVFALIAASAHGRIVTTEYKEVPLRDLKEEEYVELWKDFLDKENKLWTDDEHDERYGIFKANVDTIIKHNKEDHSWKMGITTFADMSPEEFQEEIVGGCTKPQRDESNVAILPLEYAVESVDWVAKGKVTPVKNQGQCGSCWAFSTTGAVESRFAISNGKLTSLSEQELVDCSGSDGNQGCNGGLMDYGFKYVTEEHGLCSESDYPYKGRTRKWGCKFFRKKCSGHVDGIHSWKDVQPKNEAQLMAAVSNGPVAVAIEADQTAFQLYKSGVMTGKCGDKLDHGVLAVGYGTSTNGTAYWKVKNSWGPRWGEDGYFKLCKDCNKNKGAGQCGIAAQPSYPVV